MSERDNEPAEIFLVGCTITSAEARHVLDAEIEVGDIIAPVSTHILHRQNIERDKRTQQNRQENIAVGVNHLGKGRGSTECHQSVREPLAVVSRTMGAESIGQLLGEAIELLG